MASVSVVSRPGRNSTGTLPLYVRITHKGVSRYVALGVRVRPREWNPGANRVRKRHYGADSLNKRLEEVRRAVEAAVTEAVLQPGLAEGEVPDALKRAALAVLRGEEGERAEGLDFFGFCDGVVAEFAQSGKAGTVKAYRSAVLKFARFVEGHTGTRRLPVEGVDVALLRAYQEHMVHALGNRPNTVHKSLSTVRTMLYRAIRDGAFPQERNPFFRIQLKKERVRKERLSLEEVRMIERAPLDPGGLLDQVRDWFLFAFYAGGVRFSDVALVRFEHLREEVGPGGHRQVRLAYRMKKTSTAAAVLLVPQALEVLRKYEGRRAAGRPRVFPILDGYDCSTPALELRAISARNALANKYLKGVARAAGLQVPLSFHLARHSLADYLRKSGWGVYDISKMLGHGRIGVTEQYLRGFDQDDLDTKVRLLF